LVLARQHNLAAAAFWDAAPLSTDIPVPGTDIAV
jgi:hypothetical protein